MRHKLRTFLLAAVGCGGSIEVPAPTEPSAAAPEAMPPNPSAAESVPARSPTFGKVYMQTNSMITPGRNEYQELLFFAADLYLFEFSFAPCAGATRSAGACCYIPNGRGPASPSPYTGYKWAIPGTLSLVDETTSAPVVSFDSPEIGGELLGGDAWRPGDVMTIRATGGRDIGAFEASVRALAPLATPPLSSIRRAEALTLAWTPDSNAQTMTLTLEVSSPSMNADKTAYLHSVHRGSVVCVVPDAAQTVTVDASLLADFEAGDDWRGTLLRSDNVLVRTSTGPVTVASEAVVYFWGSVL
jgi:hypothetical protein